METQPLATDPAPPRLRSQVALEIAEAFPGRAPGGRGHRSAATALAERLGITRAAVCRARQVLVAGDAELIESVRAGRLSVHAAWKRLLGRAPAAEPVRRSRSTVR